MAVSSTNASLSQVKSTFGGPNNQSAYIRNGSYVPTNGTTGNVSTTVAGLKLSQFRGADKTVTPTAPTVSASYSSSDYVRDGGYASVEWFLSSDGKLYVQTSSYGQETKATWLPAGQSATSYQFRVGWSPSALGSWINITGQHSVAGVSASGDGYYGDYQTNATYIQIGAGGTALTGAILLESTAEVAGRY